MSKGPIHERFEVPIPVSYLNDDKPSLLSPRLADLQFPKNGPVRLSDNPAAADYNPTMTSVCFALAEFGVSN